MFEGYKGGDFVMDKYTVCWISEYGHCSGDKIGTTMLKLWEYCMANEKPELLTADNTGE